MEQLTLLEYQELGYAERKERIRNNNNRIVQSMIENGYILKQIREDRSYLQDGYKDINDFAKGEFGYSTSTTSRFMGINTKFSEGGNSPFIRAEYAKYGRSKLQEMLTMDEADFELITEDTTVEQIREIKKLEEAEVAAAELEEQKNLPIMQMVAEETEDVATSQELQIDPFHEVVMKYWEKHIEILKLVHNNMITPADLAEELCPSGNKQYLHGTYMVMFYDFSSGVKVRYFKNGERIIDEYSYAEWMEKTNEIITDELFMQILVEAQKPEMQKVIEEPKKEQTKQEEKTVEPKRDKVPVPVAVQRPQAAVEEKYEPLEGQTTVEDIPGIVPEEYKETVTQEEENKESVSADHIGDATEMVSEDTRELSEEEKEQKDRYKREYFLCIAEANSALQKAEYDITIKHLQEAMEMVRNMQQANN